MTSASRTTSATAASSASLYTAPVGLQGVHKARTRVRGVRCLRSDSGVSFQPGGDVSTATTVAPARRACSAYVTQYGAGMMTSSPTSQTACSARYSASLAPVVATTCAGVYATPDSSAI